MRLATTKLCVFLGVCAGAFGQTNDQPPLAKSEFPAYAQKTFDQAQARYEAHRHDAEPAWQLARAYFDLGEFATNNTQRAELAEKAIALSRLLISRQTNLAAGHYYLGMNLGQLARTKT